MKLLTSVDCLKKYGNPNKANNMTLWVIPADIVKATPAFAKQKKIYMNVDMKAPLEKALRNAMAAGVASEIVEYNGCFNIRQKRSTGSWSLHSWGVAIDINAKTNGWGKKPTMSAKLVKCFKDAGFDWGGDWKFADGMHFQASTKLV